MNKGLLALAGLGVGAGMMYFADPKEGRRRRARACTTRPAGLPSGRD